MVIVKFNNCLILYDNSKSNAVLRNRNDWSWGNGA